MLIDSFKALVTFCLKKTELRLSKHVSIEEKVYISMYIVGQLALNRYIQEEFLKSREIISSQSIWKKGLTIAIRAFAQDTFYVCTIVYNIIINIIKGKEKHYSKLT